MITCFYPYIQLKWGSPPKNYLSLCVVPFGLHSLALGVALHPSHDMLGHNKISCPVVSILFLKIKSFALSVISGTIRSEGRGEIG